jgi:hypothetical protein
VRGAALWLGEVWQARPPIIRRGTVKISIILDLNQSEDASLRGDHQLVSAIVKLLEVGAVQ